MAKIAIIGGGISGLATAYDIQKKVKKLSQDVEMAIFERENRLGGTIKSERIEGYLCESGPQGFLDNKPETPKLVQDVGLQERILVSKDTSRKRYLYTKRALQKLPESPPALLASKILSFRGKLRVLGELWSKKAPQNAEETIADFARRHIGKEAAEKLIDAVTTGIFAGDAAKLSVKSCFPVMLALEKEGDGSLIRAMIRRLRAKRKMERETGKKARGGTEMGGGKLTTFDQGMETLISGLQEAIRAKFYLSKAVNRLERQAEKYLLYFGGQKEPVEADLVILATPAYAATKILKDFDSEMSNLLDEIPYAPITVVNFGYPRKSVASSLDGFGFLIPSIEKRDILGTIWTTSVFDGMAPPDHVALRTMIGGARNPEAAALDDQATVNLVQGELKEIMDIAADPTFIKLYRYEKAIPQYTLGHEERLAFLEKRLGDHPGLFLTGNAYRGIGVNDCTRNALLVSDRILNYLQTL